MDRGAQARCLARWWLPRPWPDRLIAVFAERAHSDETAWWQARLALAEDWRVDVAALADAADRAPVAA